MRPWDRRSRNERIVVAIRNGETTKAVAKAFGITVWAVYKIVSVGEWDTNCPKCGSTVPHGTNSNNSN